MLSYLKDHKNTIVRMTGLSIGLLPLLLGFQNCSNTTFNPTTGSSNSSQSVGGGSAPTCTQTCTISNGVGVQTCSNTSATTSSNSSNLASVCTPTMCNAGFVLENGVCVAQVASTQFQCTSYQPLILNSVSDQLTTQSGGAIPAQDSSGQGACYYYTIVGSSGVIPSSASYLTGEGIANHDQQVVSADHDVVVNDVTVWHPYIMNHTIMNMTMSGPRTLQLTGGNIGGAGTFQTADISIDNFFLVGVYPQAETLTTANVLSYYSAWGTGDSVIADSTLKNTKAVAFNPAGINLITNNTMNYSNGQTAAYSSVGLVTQSNYALVPLNVEAAGGTAQVPSVQLTNLISAQVPTTVDFRALDCGSARYLGQVYLLIK